MGIQWFLDYLSTHFEIDSAKSIIQFFRKDPLVWKAISSIEHPEDWIAFAGENSYLWKPSTFALFTLKPALLEQDFQDLKLAIPEDLQSKSKQFLETVKLTGLEPNNLQDASLLAIALRNYRQEQGAWTDLFDFLTQSKNNLYAWKGAFTALVAMVPDVEAAFEELFTNHSPQTEAMLSELVCHAISFNSE